MNVKVKIIEQNGYWAVMTIKNNFLDGMNNYIETELHKSKGQLKRKVIQFCDELNLEIEWV